MRILSWNTLEYDDAWAPGWGCPLEMQRRDALLASKENWTTTQAQDFLTQQRNRRIRQTVASEMNGSDTTATTTATSNNAVTVDLMLFQEISRAKPWNHVDDFVLPPNFEQVPCQETKSSVINSATNIR